MSIFEHFLKKQKQFPIVIQQEERRSLLPEVKPMDERFRSHNLGKMMQRQLVDAKRRAASSKQNSQATLLPPGLRIGYAK